MVVEVGAGLRWVKRGKNADGWAPPPGFLIPRRSGMGSVNVNV